MSDLDEQLKRVRLQKEQLELDRLLAKQQREKLISGLPTAAFQGLKVPLSAIASFATTNKKWFWGAWITGLFLCFGLFIYEIDKSEKERRREQRYQAKRAEIIQEKCGKQVEAVETCNVSMMDANRTVADQRACLNAHIEKNYCVEMAKLTPIAVD